MVCLVDSNVPNPNSFKRGPNILENILLVLRVPSAKKVKTLNPKSDNKRTIIIHIGKEIVFIFPHMSNFGGEEGVGEKTEESDSGDDSIFSLLL